MRMCPLSPKRPSSPAAAWPWAELPVLRGRALPFAHFKSELFWILHIVRSHSICLSLADFTQHGVHVVTNGRTSFFLVLESFIL